MSRTSSTPSDAGPPGTGAVGTGAVGTGGVGTGAVGTPATTTGSTPATPATNPATNPATATGPDPASMPYEAARDELVDIVRRLEAGSTDLEESLALWERGEALAARCQQVLDGALERLDARTGGAAEG